MVENRQKWSNKWSNNRSIVFHWTSYSCQEGSLFTDIHHLKTIVITYVFKSSVNYHIGTSLFSHTRGIPKNPDLVPYSGPFLALGSGSFTAGPTGQWTGQSVTKVGLELLGKLKIYTINLFINRQRLLNLIWHPCSTTLTFSSVTNQRNLQFGYFSIILFLHICK